MTIEEIEKRLGSLMDEAEKALLKAGQSEKITDTRKFAIQLAVQILHPSTLADGAKAVVEQAKAIEKYLIEG